MPNFNIGGGWTVGNGWGLQSYSGGNPVTAGLVMNLDAATLSANPTTWTDSVSNLVFTLNNSPTYSSANGGILQFNAASSQWASSPNQSFGSLSNWSVEVWHYYTGSNTGQLPCIVTETFVGGNINFNLGNGNGSSGNLQSGYYNGGWRTTATTYSLPTTNAWYQIVGTWDGTNNVLYVNNSVISTVAGSGTSSSSGNGIRLMNRWDTGNYWGGYLGIVRIYNGALTPTQVATNYNANKTRFGLT